MHCISTFSIVAFNSQTREWGVAVQSRYFAVSAIVSWAAANAGALATQSFGNPKHWEWAKPLLEKGKSCDEVLEYLLMEDDDCKNRQIGIIDKKGHAIAFTGALCRSKAYHVIGDNYAIQGNLLHSGTLEAMQEAFEQGKNQNRPLCDCLMVALNAGQKQGGDIRGMQSAGLYIAKENAGYLGVNDKYIDLRVDDHVRPLEKLQNLLDMHKIMYGIEKQKHLVKIDMVKDEIKLLLSKYNISTDMFDIENKFSAFLTSFNINYGIEIKQGKIDYRILDAFNHRLYL